MLGIQGPGWRVFPHSASTVTATSQASVPPCHYDNHLGSAAIGRVLFAAVTLDSMAHKGRQALGPAPTRHTIIAPTVMQENRRAQSRTGRQTSGGQTGIPDDRRTEQQTYESIRSILACRLWAPNVQVPGTTFLTRRLAMKTVHNGPLEVLCVHCFS